jgi:two-component system, chemotaxis family, sensor kinase CheA
VDEAFQEQLWQMFESEVREHLGRIEELLAQGASDPDTVNEMFRAYHSVKGVSAAMAMHGMEQLAHAAEDVLDRVRKGKEQLSEGMSSLLLATVDALRVGHETAVAERRDQATDAGLMAKLNEWRRRDAAPPAAAQPSPAQPSPVQPSPAPVAPVAAAPPPPPAATGGAAPAADATGIPPLGDLSGLAVAILALVGELPEPGPDTVAAVVGAAEAAGCGGVAAVAMGLLDPAPGALARGLLLADLVATLRGAEIASDAGCGAIAVSEGAAGAVADAFFEAVAMLRDEPRSIATWQAVLDLALVQGVDWLVEVADAAVATVEADAATGPSADAAFEAALDVATIATIGDMGDDPSIRTRAAEVRDGLLALVMPTANTAVGRFADESSLSPTSAATIAQTVAEGHGFAEVIVDLARDRAVADRVAEILGGAGAVTNRSRLDLGDEVFQFLITTDDANGLIGLLRATDPMGVCVRSVRSVPAAGGSGPELWASPVAEAGTGIAPHGTPPTAVAKTDTTTGTAAVPASEGTPDAGAGSARTARVDPMLRVPTAAVDAFMDRIGDLRMSVNSLASMLGDGSGRGNDSATLVDGLSPALRDRILQILAEQETQRRSLTEALSRVDAHVRQLHAATLALRVVPVGLLFNRLLRPVRDTAIGLGKEVELVTEGADVQIDKSMVELLVDPLMHLVRNAIDHGIEAPDVRVAAGKQSRGRLVVRASQRSASAVIEIQDDGGGVDPERVRRKALGNGSVAPDELRRMTQADIVRLVFRAGFSTRDVVTETSGRGVGLDVVQVALNRLGGSVDIVSEVGVGTRFVLEFPLSAALQRVLRVTCAGQDVALPERCIREVMQHRPEAVIEVNRRAGLDHRGRFLPTVDLAGLIGWRDHGTPGPEGAAVVVIGDDREQVGILVDGLVGRQEIFLKPLHPLLLECEFLAGAAALGEGEVMVALDADALLRRALTMASGHAAR